MDGLLSNDAVYMNPTLEDMLEAIIKIKEVHPQACMFYPFTITYLGLYSACVLHHTYATSQGDR